MERGILRALRPTNSLVDSEGAYSMANVEITLACVDYLDRTRPLIDGTVETPGIDLIPVPLKPLDLTARFAEFDVAEVILPVYMALRGRGDERFVGIPVFPYRA